MAFPNVLGPTLEEGEFRWRRWIFNFDYRDLVLRVGENANVEVIVRSYDQARTSICRDFLSIFSLGLRDLDVDDEVFENMSLPLKEYVLMFLKNRSLVGNEGRVVLDLVSQKASSIALSPLVRMDLFRRFSEINRNLFTQYGIPEPNMEEISTLQGCPDPYIDELFSENLQAR